MIRQLMMVTTCLAAAASAQTRFENGLTVTFSAGGSIRIHTESTLANSPLSSSGVVAIAEGDVSHRMVIDRQGKVMFAYDIGLSSVPNDRNAFTLRVKPADPNHFIAQYVTFAPGDQIRVEVHNAPEVGGVHTVRSDGNIAIDGIGDVKAGGLSPAKLTAELRTRLKDRISDPYVAVTVVAARRDYPTIAAERELLAVRIGQAVNLDILFNPTTGEKIFDVIQPIEPPSDTSRRIAPEDEISLEQIRISINGTLVKEFRNSWMIGGGVKIGLPGRATVYLAVKPSTSYPFQPVGRVDGGKLAFPLGNDMVEIVSRSNVLKRSETGIVWVYPDTASKPGQPVTAEVGMLGDLLPKR
jgi:hypothetical protein